ncbi:MAG: hypothetical protein EXR75_03080 [Myxococcales bacterium]|nr:hypothetical protein [Myxococcales bacterium]
MSRGAESIAQFQPELPLFADAPRGSRSVASSPGRAVLGLAIGLTSLASLAGVGCAEAGLVSNPEGPIWAHHPSGAMAVTARRELAIPHDRAGESYERAAVAIDPQHRRLFVGTSDGGMSALDAVTLRSRWRFQTGAGIHSEPCYEPSEDAVYFGSNDGGVYKLRAADGKLVWRAGTNAEILRRPVVRDGVVYVVNANDTLLALDRADGKPKWFRQRSPASGMEISGYAGPAVHGGTVLTGFSDGVVMAYRTTDGSEAWPAPVDLNLRATETGVADAIRYLDVDTTPVVAKIDDTELVFVSSYETGTYALHLETGAEAWHNEGVVGVTDLVMWSGRSRSEGEAKGGAEARGAAKPKGASEARGAVEARGAAEPTRILIASSGLTGIFALDPKTGAELWHRELPAGGLSAVEPWAGALLVGTTRYGLFLVHPLDGGVVDGIASGASFAARPVAHGLHAYALSNAGVLVALGIVPPR